MIRPVSIHVLHLFAVDHVPWCDIMHALHSSNAYTRHGSVGLVRQVPTQIMLAGQRWKGKQGSNSAQSVHTPCSASATIT